MSDILVVDDEADIRTLIGDILTDEGHGVRLAWDSETVLNEINRTAPDLIVLDIWLKDSRLDGIDILKQVRRDNPAIPVVIISGHGNIEIAVAAIKQGAYDFIEKPFKADRLLVLVERAIEAARLRRENEELRLRAGGQTELIGKSSTINQVRNSIEKVAPTGSRVLITGPAGSGKEVVARLIHARSRRGDGPFVGLNCATMRPDRLEVELFGTEHGQDGLPRKVGTFEQAHGGTLLLDEVADMPLETQGKIVRVLQEQTFERVGGSSRVEVDVRVIASSNRDLPSEIEAGRFRQDLFYRLSVVPIRVPPLTERREDIPLLVEHFMRRFAERTGKQIDGVDEKAMAELSRYEWPGNVRELENTMERAVVLSTAPLLDSRTVWLMSATATPQSAAVPSLKLHQNLEWAERETMRRALEQARGVKKDAAELMGISQRALSHYLAKYRIET